MMMLWTRYARHPLRILWRFPTVCSHQEQQKWSSCSWLLLREFVKMRQEQERDSEQDQAADSGQRHESAHNMDEALPLPSIPYVRLDLPFSLICDRRRVLFALIVEMPSDHDET
jgi:hypothetical protein